MTKTAKIFALMPALAFMALSSCEGTKQNPISNQVTYQPTWQPLKDSRALPTVEVTDSLGNAIAGAEVLVGQAVGDPFSGNFVKTNSTGIATLPATWTNTLAVTAQANGFIRQTLMNQKAGKISIKLNPAYLAQKAQLKGLINGLPVTNGDKLIDFGMMIYAMTRTDLLSFDLDTLISPYKDSMSIVGQKVQVPSNVSLPTQKENYIIGITLSKPEYRSVTPTLGTKKVFSAAGRFPFKEVADILRSGKPFIEAANYFTLTSGSLKTVQVTAATQTQDLTAADIAFNTPITVSGPKALNTGEFFIAAAVSDMTGYFIPTGFKSIDPGATATVNTVSGKPTYILNTIKRSEDLNSEKPGSDRMSLSLLPYQAAAVTDMLPLMKDPSVSMVNNGYNVKLTPVANLGLTQLATLIAVSDINEITTSSSKVISLDRKWEVMAMNWPNEIQLPSWPLDNPNIKKRFEVKMLASSIAKTGEVIEDFGSGLVNATTHLTHSSAEF